MQTFPQIVEVHEAEEEEDDGNFYFLAAAIHTKALELILAHTHTARLDSLKAVPERRQLHLALVIQRNGEIPDHRKIDDDADVDGVIEVPVGANVLHQAHNHTVRNLHRHLQNRFVVPLQRSRIRNTSRRDNPIDPDP